MKSIQQAMLEEIYTKSVEISHRRKQVIHNEDDKDVDGSFYVTLHQLETILKECES